MSKSKVMNIVAYDDSSKIIFGVERTWAIGAALFSPFFDVVLPVISWSDLLTKVEILKRTSDCDINLQVWGHGWQGMPLINSLPAPADDTRWGNISSVWFRSCLVAGGEEGIEFMRKIAAYGCEVAAHAVVIGTRWGAQSYLFGVRPNEEPWWPAELNPKDVMDTAGGWLSSPLARRTVMFWTMRLPKWLHDQNI